MKNVRLCLDVGNSNIKAGLFESGELTKTWSWPTSEADLAAQDICALGYADVALSSVVPSAAMAVKRALARNSENNMQRLFELDPSAQNILTAVNPETGADRIAEAVAAWLIYGEGKKPTIVLGFGTATTLHAISAQGRILGGYIAPGVSAMLEILHLKCALLPKLNIAGASAKLGWDTQSHMKNGVFLGHIGLIRQWIEQAELSFEKDAQPGGAANRAVVVATGHSLISVADEISSAGSLKFEFVDHDLALKGLNILAGF